MVSKFLLSMDYLLIVNIMALLAMLLDKILSMSDLRRIPEKAFFALSLFGGFAGVLCGAILFRHKIQKFSFWIPCIIGLGMYCLLVSMLK